MRLEPSSSRVSQSQRFALLAYLVLLLATPCRALPSRECKANVKDSFEYYQGKEHCYEPVCGNIHVPVLGLTFLERQSRKCQAFMWQYRDDVTLGLGVTGASKRLCATSKNAYKPTNPVVVESPLTKNFMICTVPKVACSNIRKLLNVLIRFPDPAATTIWDQTHDAHFDFYPTVWHYKMNAQPEADRYPSFIIGRNPYVRVLSGFLNKMASVPGPGGDDWTMKDTNTALGLSPSLKWRPTVASFHRFVRLLARHGAEHIDQHFRIAIRACGFGIRYEYYLRLEDMAQWFPCFMEGLNLRAFTQFGWEATDSGKMYVGTASNNGGNHGGTAGMPVGILRPNAGANTSCWWSPPGMSCEEYYERMMDENGEVVPLDEPPQAAEMSLHDGHDTGAAGRWQRYYTQEIGDMVYNIYRRDFRVFRYAKETFE